MLPDYSPSPPAPPYSFEPSTDELRLEFAPQRRVGPLSGRALLKRLGQTTLVLHDQADDSSIPSYGRNSVIRAVICFDNSANITSVSVKIRGAVDTTLSEFGAKTKQLLRHRLVLWKKSSSTDRSTCPGQLAFSYPLPSTYMDHSEEIQFPPSFRLFSPGFFVRVHYSIIVTVVRTRLWKLDFWPSVRKDKIPFNYSPRSRPNRPIVHTPCFLSYVKMLPEEWYQATSKFQTRPYWQSREPLYCHFFIPSARIYGVTDSIPFHIQLNGPTSSLHEFFPQKALHHMATSDSSFSALSIHTAADTTRLKSKTKSPRGKARLPCVRVVIIRQVVVHRNGSKVWRNSIIGEGVVQPLPPPHFRDRCLGAREESLDWTGHVKCADDVTSADSFATSLVHVQHFLSLAFTPPEPHTSPFIELNMNIPIKLVSESYSEPT
ncbi:hypothetical protein APHAL10511_008341 [Amanita phalloides]|nr:hypothetical protein APHAL10511_008341 [Amanita phalloides]